MRTISESLTDLSDEVHLENEVVDQAQDRSQKEFDNKQTVALNQSKEDLKENLNSEIFQKRKLSLETFAELLNRAHSDCSFTVDAGKLYVRHAYSLWTYEVPGVRAGVLEQHRLPGESKFYGSYVERTYGPGYYPRTFLLRSEYTGFNVTTIEIALEFGPHSSSGWILESAGDSRIPISEPFAEHRKTPVLCSLKQALSF